TEVLVAAGGRAVRIEGEDLAAHELTEEHAVAQRRDPVVTVHDDTGSGLPAGHQRIAPPPFHNRVRHCGVAARVHGVDTATADEAEAAFPDVPAQVCAGRHGTDFLDRVLPDIRNVHGSRIAVPAEALRVAHTQGVDLAQRAVVTDERIVGRDAIPAVRAAR